MGSSFYTTGRKPQYGKARWEKYEALRVRGFSKNESRTLSKITTGNALLVLSAMIKTRQHLLNKAIKEEWSRYRYYVKVRDFYRKNNLTSVTRPDGTRVKRKDGRADVFVWFHRQENMLARQRGWRKTDPTVSRRPKKKTKPRKGFRKGDIKAQKVRVLQRAYAHKLSFSVPIGSRVSPGMRREWVFGSGGLVATGRRKPERQDEMRRAAKRLGYTGRLVF